MKRLTPLAIQEIAGHKGMTHVCKIKAGDTELAAQTTNNTLQDIKLGTIPKNTVIVAVMAVLLTPFEDLSDAAYNATALSIGDAGSATRYINAVELNRNGTEITEPSFSNTAYGPLTADTDLVARFGSMSAKKISDLDKGEVAIFVQLLNIDAIAKMK
jgi:hypothetical protein